MTLKIKGGKGIVKTGISIACPPGTYGRVAPRSGLAVKKFIDVGAGVIDADYRGEIGVVLFNFSQENDFTVSIGDRIAQLVLEQVSMVPAVEVQELTETERGAGGFGSTGVSSDTSSSGNNKRPISPTSSIFDLLVFLDGVEELKSKASLRTKLKSLALKEDSRLMACVTVYQANEDMESMLETLKLLVQE